MSESPSPLTIEPLGKHHDRAAFSCGIEALDRYLHRQARQDERRNLTRVFIALGGESHRIAGFYTLSSYKIDLGDLPEAARKNLPHYPDVPAALIGRLAVGLAYRGRGLGGMLLVDALRRIVETGRKVAVHAVVVQAKNDDAVSFYRKFGFIAFPSRPNRLFLPVATAEQLF